MIKAGINGAVTWLDLSTPNISGAESFYPELLAWDEVERSETPTGVYYIGKVGDHQVGGMMEQGPELEGMPASWTIMFYVDDIDATVGKVAELGGSVLTPPFDIPGGARIAIISDPTGGMFGLFAGPPIEGEYYSTTPGAVSWVELLTRDTSAAEAFYTELFGWTAETSETPTTVYTVFKLGDEMVAGMMVMPEMVPAEAPAHWSGYFTVADCAATETHCKDLGGQVLMPTMTIDMGKFAVLEDPAGAKFNVMEYT